ncbi:hypothetical protein BZL30_5256 [Mycobacterium kansasii]|uniref:Uncharacterized protein n=1 Tax=Mycobacterium kansasii TaxID=1768 RepID=A0A1V3WZ87_MYCKA|nr:hypothetical protein BZL30_5256 [Mycobacterium kansasii]
MFGFGWLSVPLVTAGWFGVGMVPEFAWLPPEINSARIFAGAGAGRCLRRRRRGGLAAELAGRRRRLMR